MKDKKMIAKCLILVGIILIAAGSVMFAMDKDKYFKTDKKNDSSNNTTKSIETSIGEIKYSGVYEKDGSLLKLYQLGDKVSVNLESEFISHDSINSLSDNTLVCDNVLTIKYELGKVIVTYENNDEVSGDYNIVGDYSKEDFFVDNYGDPSYLDGKYNIEYGNDNTKILMFRIDESNVRIDMSSTLSDNLSPYSSNFAIQSDGSLVSRTSDDEIVVTINGDKINVKVNTENTESSNLIFNGDYNKVRVLSIDDIISEIQI